MSKGFVDRDRKTEYLSAKIFGDDRIRKVKSYCRLNNINIKFFLEELIDAFFKNKENELMSLSKEELVKMILEKEADNK